MIKFQIEDKNPAVRVGLVESAGRPCLTLNDIKVAFLSPDTGRLGTLLLSVREAHQLDSLGIKIEGRYLALNLL